jgi:hypothetical protein
MTEYEQQNEPDEVPTDEQLDVEGPNESAPGHEPDDAGDAQEEAEEQGEA